MSPESEDVPNGSDDLALRVQALEVLLASIRKVCEAGWRVGEPCRLCGRIGRHSETCYTLKATGFDLLEEHDATVRENDSLRAALAAKLPVNGHHIKSGATYKSLRERAAAQFKPPK